MARSFIARRVADGVTFVEGPASNWVVLVGADSVGLIDTGYPADIELVEASIIEAGGKNLPLTTILLTHGHSDHSGSAAELVRRYGSEVLVRAEELPNVTRDITEQVSVAELLPRLWRPETLRWAWRAWRAGGLADVAVPSAGVIPDGRLEVAGFTVVPIPTPGHTTGHSAYLIPSAAALVTGDALVTAHPTSSARGPQLLDDVFHADAARTRSSLDAIAKLYARVILPGHGPMRHEHPAFAVSAARFPSLARRETTPRRTDDRSRSDAPLRMLGWASTANR